MLMILNGIISYLKFGYLIKTTLLMHSNCYFCDTFMCKTLEIQMDKSKPQVPVLFTISPHVL